MNVSLRIVNTLKEHPDLACANNFMKVMRAVAGLLFDAGGNVFITGPYVRSEIRYHKEVYSRLNLYLPYLDDNKRRRYKRQQVTLTSVCDVASNGAKNAPKLSRVKTVNSFVANYIHYLDGLICHYVIEKLAERKDFALATVHDCFYIRPSLGDVLNKTYKTYKKGLLLASNTHLQNCKIWLRIILHFAPESKQKQRLKLLSDAVLKREYKMLQRARDSEGVQKLTEGVIDASVMQIKQQNTLIFSDDFVENTSNSKRFRHLRQSRLSNKGPKLNHSYQVWNNYSSLGLR